MNFLQFDPYGKFAKQRYRQQFEKQFDFLNFKLSKGLECPDSGTSLR